MPTHVAFLGPDLFSAYVDMVHGLKRAGARVSGIGHTPVARLDPRLQHLLDDYRSIGNPGNAKQVLAAVAELGRHHAVDRLETGDESLVLGAAMARRTLELPGLSVRAAQLCRDKPAMKEALRQAGVPTAASAAVSSLGELRQFVEREGFPVVLKPRAALGSLGTLRADSVRDLERGAAELGLDQGHSVAVEEWVEGHEGFYDTLTIDGRVEHEFISHYYPNVLPALKDRSVAPQIASTNRVELDSYEELRAMGRKVIEVFDIGTSATHMEWFFGPKGLKFSEIGARPPGERIWDLYSAGNDMDMWFEWAAVTLYGRPASKPSRRFATGSVQIRPDRDGRISGYDGVKDALKVIKPWLVQHRLPPVGTPTDPIHKGYLNNVWFRLRHPDYDELCQLMTFLGRRLRVFAR